MAVCLLSFFVVPFYRIAALAYVTAAAEIPVNCLEIPDDKTHTYTIFIESENEVSPEPKSDTLEITENGTGKFEIEIDEPGTFLYRIYEKPGDEDDIQYDENVYYVTVFVENADENELRYAVSAAVAGSDEKPDQIVFENKTLGASESVMPKEPAEPTEPTETTASSSVTDSSPASSTDDSSSRTSDTTASSTEDTSSANDSEGSPFTELIDSVLTGDSFPAHVVRVIMLIVVLIAISAFLFKRDHNEEEDKNEK